MNPQVENRSMTNSCLHKFCFTCLQEWSKVTFLDTFSLPSFGGRLKTQVKAECPLCKGKFSSILYNIRLSSLMPFCMFYLLQIVLIDIIKSFNIHVINHSNFIIFQKTRSDSEYDSYPLPPPSRGPRADCRNISTQLAGLF